ncbi:30S ribosomal protein S8 [Candidatus Manganitrophus noduliformans]|uniref:Small ribosomal subunit protein uS8 n=1 Tax=Candidatus Manganitrophus noduliformans TaxID=2606439 RepID=A0A7X6DPR8_9BACT|nr:30S ribosomal protein S8 [Candidatus Manganitrophus noduliformans]NKE71054.1 30S ribosomal protein S8 [Candidatus Manganitrophus noduliformans]
MTDPISDMLTRIRNAKMRKHEVVDIPLSKLKVELARILKEEGFIRNYRVVGESVKKNLRVYLKYVENDEPVISDLQRVSKPGRRVYVGKDQIPSVKGGIGVAILSTSKGLMTDQKSREAKVGGEVLCYIW